MSLPTLLGYQRASAFVNATKLASQPLFSSDEEYKISNVLSNTFFIDIDHVSIAIHIVIVLSPSPSGHVNGHDASAFMGEIQSTNHVSSFPFLSFFNQLSTIAKSHNAGVKTLRNVLFKLSLR